MKKKALKLNGLRTPKPIVFIHGFMNGRMKTAAADTENGCLNSAYIHGHVYLFDELCKKRVIRLDRELSEVRAEAETLILELDSLTVPALDRTADHQSAEAKLPNTIAGAQASRAAAANAAKSTEIASRRKEMRENILARRTWIIRRLIKIREQIVLSERICAEELGATADALKARFCTYGHGALLKPVRPNYIPEITYEGFLTEYYTNHEALKKKINAVLEKEAG